MAELEDVTLDGKPLHSLRVADLKAALEQRSLPKSGQKNALIKRLKGALMLENLQRSSTSHAGLQPNSQIGEEMSQNSFIKQYLAKQQELLRQRMEREAREAAEADDTNSPAGPDEDDHNDANDSSSYLPDKHHKVASRTSLPRAEEDAGADQLGRLSQDLVLGTHRSDASTASVSQDSSDASAARIWRPLFSQEEVATPSPPRAVASLSVRVVGQPERQGVPLIVPRPQEREGTAPVEAGPAHPKPQRSRSARAQEDSDEDEDDEDDDDSDEDDEWGPSSRGKKNVRAPPAPRSRRKLQPPQHIPPHHSPLQLRQPTPPPSPPPELSYPLPDTPKQSPPEQDELEAPSRDSVSSHSSPQRPESSSSSRSSSPEPPPKRRHGPLSLLVRKMESEGAFDAGHKKEEEEEGDAVAANIEQVEAAPSVLVFPKAADDAHVSCEAEKTPVPQDSSQEHAPTECDPMPALLSAAEGSPQESVKVKEAENEHKECLPQDKNEQEEKRAEEKLPENTRKSPHLSLKREWVSSPSSQPTSYPHTSPITSPPAAVKRKRMFSEVPPPECLITPSKPEQVSVLMAGPRHATAEVEMETEASNAAHKSTARDKGEDEIKPTQTKEFVSPQQSEVVEEIPASKPEVEQSKLETAGETVEETESKIEKVASPSGSKAEEMETEPPPAETVKEAATEQERGSPSKAVQEAPTEPEKVAAPPPEAEKEAPTEPEKMAAPPPPEADDKTPTESENMAAASPLEAEKEAPAERDDIASATSFEVVKETAPDPEKVASPPPEAEEKMEIEPKKGAPTPSEAEKEIKAEEKLRTSESAEVITEKVVSLPPSGAEDDMEVEAKKVSALSASAAEENLKTETDVVASKAIDEVKAETQKVASPQGSDIANMEQVTSFQVCEPTKEIQEPETERLESLPSSKSAGEMRGFETEHLASPKVHEGAEEMQEMETQKLESSHVSKTSEEKQDENLEKTASHQTPKVKDNAKTSVDKRKAEKAKERSKKERSSKRQSSSSSSSSSSDSSSSDSDSESSSSSSSSSGSSPRGKPSPPTRKQVEEKKTKQSDDAGAEKKKASRDVKQAAAAVAEPTGPVSMELQNQPESVTALAHPASQEAPEASESRPDEKQCTLPCRWAIAKPVRNQVSMSTTPKAVAARKISLTTAKPEGTIVEPESGGAAGRKRRWGSSTAVTAKKPSISITTESLKSLIPDLKPLQEAVVDLHPDEGHFSGDEDSRQQVERDEDQGLQIRRTVTQVVASEGQENGQKEKEEDEEEEEEPMEEEKEKTPKKLRRESSSEVAMETQAVDAKKVTPSDSVVRRSISQQKVAVSITIDDPVRTGRQLSPPRGKTSNIIHICNLVRPFTLSQLKELLNRTGTVLEEGFWIDKIKSHCYVTYSSTEEAVATREALHGVKWPSSNPKVLRVDFCEQDELNFHKGLLTGEDPRVAPAPSRPAAPPPPLLPPTKERERERERDGTAPTVRDQWAEREREMERRERTRSEREWDRDKVRDFRDERDAAKRSRSRDRDRKRKERGKSKERKTEKKEKPEEPPAKLLDDLFRKTKAAPCIYWLPHTEEQATQRGLERAERMKEREKRRKELEQEEDKKREEERKERVRGREREGGNAVVSGGGSGRPAEADKDKERERERERDRVREKEPERRREGNRSRDAKPVGGSRRSRSHSNPSRDRRR